MKSPTISDTKDLVVKAFKGIKDKAGKPYINHLIKVSKTVKPQKEDYIIIALLHDLIEDTKYTINDLKDLGYNKFIITAVNLLTKTSNTDYDVYIKNIKNHKGARAVKIADMKHNSDLSRLSSITIKDINRNDKYLKSIKFLENVMDSYTTFLVESTISLEIEKYSNLMNKSKDKQGLLKDFFDNNEKELNKIKSKYTSFLKKFVSKKLRSKTKILTDVKSLKSLKSKIISRKKPLNSLRDIVRGAVLFEYKDDADEMYKSLLRKHGAKIISSEEKTKGEKEFGYYGSYHVIFKFEGIPIELQIMTKKLWSYKETAHDIYNKYRDKNDKTPTKQDSYDSKKIFSLGNKKKYTKEEVELIENYIEELIDS